MDYIRISRDYVRLSFRVVHQITRVTNPTAILKGNRDTAIL